MRAYTTFLFNPVVKRKQIFDLAACRFICKQRDPFLAALPGVNREGHIDLAL